MFSRFERLIGNKKLEYLSKCKVLVFGVGGVGGYVVEGLVRSGVGNICVCDNDQVALSNLNRQIIATYDTIGMDKVDVISKRVKSINPNCEITTKKMFYLPQNANQIDLSEFDYVVDAIDTVSAKIHLAVECEKNKIPLISSMGTGNKLDPSKLEISDIYKTSVCPLAKVMRHELKKRRVKKLKVVYSKEYPIKQKDRTPGSSAFVPSSAGLLIASEVIKDLLKNKI